MPRYAHVRNVAPTRCPPNCLSNVLTELNAVGEKSRSIGEKSDQTINSSYLSNTDRLTLTLQ